MAFEVQQSDALKGTGRRRQCATDVSPVKWTINELYGLGRDDSQFIVYRAKRRTSDKPRAKRHEHKPVAYFPTLEGALMWVVMRQAHFDNEPTIDTSLLDAFQRYCRSMDQTKADIRVLAGRLATSLEPFDPRAA